MAVREEQTTARIYIPERPTLRKLKEAAEHCKACELYKLGTQTVFGEAN
jgi:uracil-DNA glycosylase